MEKLLAVILLLPCILAQDKFDCDTAGGLKSAFDACKHHVSVTRSEAIADYLKDLCGAKAEAFKACYIEHCTVADGKELRDKIKDHRDRLCVRADEIQQEVLTLKKRFECVFNQSQCTCEPPIELCNYWTNYEFVESCYERLSGEFFDKTFAPYPITDNFALIRRYTREALRCIRARTDRKARCGELERDTLIYYHLAAHIPPGWGVYFSDARARVINRDDWGPRDTYSAFGDPHIRMGKESGNAIQTCGDLGDTLFLEMENFLTVTGHNIPVSAEDGASLMETIKIEVHDSTGEVVGEYLAEKGQLPPSFVGGQDVVKVDDDEVTVKQFKDDYMQIVHQGGAFAVVIGRYLPREINVVLTIRAPKSLLEFSSGILKDGCNVPIDRDALVSTRRRKRQASELAQRCAATCGQDGLEALLKETCEFDCLSTGDTDLAMAGNPTAAEEEAGLFDAVFGGSDATVYNSVAICSMAVASWLLRM